MSTKLTKTTLNDSIFNAVRDIRPDSLRTLLKLEGGNINAINWKNGSTPLCYAIHYATEEIVTMLLDNGADIYAKNSIGETPLHVAAWAGRVNILTILLDHGINKIINEIGKNEIGKSAPEFDKKFDAFINAENRSGYTPIEMAYWNRSDDAMALLVEKGCDISQFQLPPRIIRKIFDNIKNRVKEKDGEIELLKRRVAELEAKLEANTC